MGRVLHLVDTAGATSLEIAALRRLRESGSNGLRNRVLLLGGNLEAERIQRSGLVVDGIIPAPRALPELAWPALRGLLRPLRSDGLVHAWSLRAARSAILAGWRGPMVTTLDPPPPARDALRRGLRRETLRRAGRLLCGSRREREAWTELGAPLTSITVLPRPIDSPPFDPVRRQTVRKRWGIDDDTMLIAPLEAPSSAIVPFRIVYLAGVMAVGGAKVRPVIPRGAQSIERAARFTERHPGWWSLVVEDADMTDLLDALDLGLWLGPAPRRAEDERFLECAACRGLPIVAVENDVTRALAGLASNITLEPTGKAIQITRQLFETCARLQGGSGLSPVGALAERHDPARWRVQLGREHRRALGMSASAAAVRTGAAVTT